MSGPPVFLDQNPPRGDPQVPAPFRFEGVGIRMFPVRANTVALQDVCDYFLNGPAASCGRTERYEPLPVLGSWGVVYLQTLEYERAFSTSNDYKNLGYTSQRELVFALPIVEKDGGGGVKRIGMFVPYLFVDNDWSLIGGREVLGYPKLQGWFQELPKELSKVYPLLVSARVIRNLGGQATPRPLVEVKDPFASFLRSGLARDVVIGEPKDLWPFGSIDHLYGGEGQFAVPAEILDMLRALAGSQVWNLQLKQLRDAVVQDDACYQALVGFDTDATFRAGGLLLNKRIRIYEYDSLRIAKRLGLDISSKGEVLPESPSWYYADFELSNVENLCARCQQS